MRTAQGLALLKVALQRDLEAYISACYELTLRDGEQAGYWRRWAEVAERDKARYVRHLELMILSVSGEYVAEIDGLAPGPNVSIVQHIGSNAGTVTGLQGGETS